MYLLDTNSVTLLLNDEGGHTLLRRRALEIRPEQLAVSIVTVEEMLQGAVARIRRGQQQADGGLSGYRLLGKILQGLASYEIVPFDERCLAVFCGFPAAVRRLGGNDCRIGATAIAYELTVVTRNTRDFARIPRVRYEDWTL